MNFFKKPQATVDDLEQLAEHSQFASLALTQLQREMESLNLELANTVAAKLPDVERAYNVARDAVSKVSPIARRLNLQEAKQAEATLDAIAQAMNEYRKLLPLCEEPING